MATESSPICFRVPANERSLLEVVAQFQEQTLSAFARDAVIRFAQDIVDRHGAETVFKKFETLEAQRAAELNAKLEGIREQLLQQDRAQQGTEVTASTDGNYEQLLPQQHRRPPNRP
jgi:hypothetical protein